MISKITISQNQFDFFCFFYDLLKMLQCHCFILLLSVFMQTATYFGTYSFFIFLTISQSFTIECTRSPGIKCFIVSASRATSIIFNVFHYKFFPSSSHSCIIGRIAEISVRISYNALETARRRIRYLRLLVFQNSQKSWLFTILSCSLQYPCFVRSKQCNPFV